MQKILAQLCRGTLYAGAIIFLTWLFFGPVAGFHHMIRCGILCPVFLDGESPQGGHPMWGEFEVHFSVVRFAFSVVLWAMCVFFSVRFLGAQMSRAATVAISTSGLSPRFRIGVISGLVLVASGLVSSLIPIYALLGIVFPIAISVVALIGGYCSFTSLFTERGFNRTIAALCTLLSIYVLFRFAAHLFVIFL